MKTKKFSKFLSLLLALVLVVGMLPATAMAAEASVSTAEDLAAALGSAADGDTITLTGPVSGNFIYTGSAGKTVTIDGGGNTITGTIDAALTLSGGGTVILKNITLQGGNGSSNSYGLYVGSSTIQVYSVGTVSVFGGGAIDRSYGLYHAGSGTVKISTAVGGSGDSSYGIRNNSSGTVYANTATGGSGTSESDGVYNVSAGTVNLETAEGGSSVYSSKGIYNRGAGTVNVVTAIGGAASNSSSGDSRGAYNEAGGTINVGTANGGVAAVSYGIYNNGNGTVNANIASGGSDLMNVYTSWGVYNYAGGTINVTTAAGGSATNYSYGAENCDSGVINVQTATSDAAASGHGNTVGDSVHSGAAVAALTLNKGTGASCVLDSISVAASGTTTVGTLPPVSKDGVAGSWFTNEDLTAAFSGTTVTAATTLYSTFYVKPPETTYVLINGVEWATHNVDAPGTFTANLEDKGMFYQWNSKVGWPETGAIGSITATDGTTIWNSTWSSSGTPSTSDTWATANDPSPTGYRVPTDTEIQTLLDETKVTKTWSTQNGVNGYKFTDIATGNFIFLPASGLRYNNDGTLYNAGERGNYWSSSAYNVIGAYNLEFYSNIGLAFYDRANGFSVRPVVAPSNFVVTTDNSTANNTETLGLVGTSVASSADSIATAAISSGYIAITSGSAGTATITVTDSASHSATIAVAVSSSGAITIGTITKYIASPSFTVTTNNSTANDTATMGLVGTSAASSSDSIAMAAISNGYIAITSVSEGTTTVTVTDDSSHSATIAVAVDAYGSITIGTITKYTSNEPPAPAGAPAITSANHTTVTAGIGGTFQITATGTGTMAYSLSGTVPSAVSIDSSTGLMTIGEIDINAMQRNTYTFTVNAANGINPAAAQSFTLTVLAPPVIHLPGFVNGTVGVPYEVSLPGAVTGASPITWSVASGTLSAGLSLSSDGVVSGTPTTAGTSTFSIRAENSDGSDTKQYSLTIQAVAEGNDTPTGGGGSTATTTPATTISGSTATTTVTPAVSGGAATGSVTADQMSDALKKAQAAAGTSGTPNVTIQISGASGATSVGTAIPRASLQSLVSGGVCALTISGPTGSVSFDAAALKTISGASGDVTVTIANTDASTLSDAARALVGSHPVFTFSVTSGGRAISRFGGDVAVSVPYTLSAGEDPNAIVIYYIAADGTPTPVQDAHYDAATGTVVFTTTHFSTYAVGYNKVSFTDVASGVWYHDAVTFLAARGITSGTTATTFGPDATLTRGQFITMLLRAYGIAAVTNPTDNFSDAGSTYYTGYLAAAKKLNITTGAGNNKFAPDQAITRQEMFTLLYNALMVLDQLPSDTSGKTLADFTDAASIASWANNAMTVLVKAGTVTGSNSKLNPTGTTTRAEMAQVLYNLLGK